MRFGELSDNFYRYCRRWKRNSDEFISSVLDEIGNSSKTDLILSDDEDSILGSPEEVVDQDQDQNHANPPMAVLPLHMNFRHFSFLMFRSPHVVIHKFVGGYKTF